MLTEEALREVHRQSAVGKWTYPQLFDALEKMGVERYETNVLKHEITYVGEGTSIKHGTPEGFETLTLGAKYDEAALKAALKHVQSGQTNYSQFLAEIAAAGIPFYRVDMKPRTVTYHAQDKRYKLVEKVPQP